MEQRLNALNMTQALNAYSTHADLLNARSKTKDPRVQAQLAPLEHRAFAREFATESPISAAVSLPFAIPLYTLSKKLGLQNSRTPGSMEQMTQGFRGLGEGLGIAGRSMLDQLSAFGRN